MNDVQKLLISTVSVVGMVVAGILLFMAHTWFELTVFALVFIVLLWIVMRVSGIEDDENKNNMR